MSDTLSQGIEEARAGGTVLDDPDDLDNTAILSWMKHHVAFRHLGHKYVIGTEALPTRWRSEALRISIPQDGLSLLRPLKADPAAMQGLRRALQRIGGQAAGPGDDAVIAAMSQALATKLAWIIRDAKRPPVAGNTNPAVYLNLNGALGTKVDFQYLSRWEGNQYLRGYVPFIKGVTAGRSGMTIATGFDIGQIDADGMKALGLPDTVGPKIAPYLNLRFTGQTKLQVAAIVARIGPVPVLTKPEADAADLAVHGKHLRAAVASWNTRRKAGVPEFKALPGPWQTVLFSRTYHQGVGMPDTAIARPFYTAATEGRWSEAADLLKNYPVTASWYKTRVAQEAALLRIELPPPVATAPASPSAAATPTPLAPRR